MVKEKYYKNNEILFYIDEVMKVYILVKGNVVIVKNISSGKWILGKNVIEFGELVGEIYYFLYCNLFWDYVIVFELIIVLEISSID